MKKVLSIVLSLVMVLCMVPTMAFADTAVYSDIEGEKCEASVELLTELGVVDGYGDGTYQPEGIVTRAEMAKLIVTQLGLNPTSSTTSFTDMDGASWAIPYVGYAESLGIINGYGDGRFGPNDTVTYDQVVTMIVRAIGYTEACNEMQGQWPAVFVQKANELGILKDITTTGDIGANRGDVAIMLANALRVDMVYADSEGVTQPRNDADGNRLTMYDGLVKGGGKVYGVVTDYDVTNATKNINELLGAAGQIVYNEDGDVISVTDIQSTFLTGKFNAAGNKFTSDGVDYAVRSTSLKVLDARTGKVIDHDGEGIPSFSNGEDSVAVGKKTTYGAISAITGDYGTSKVTLACTISGKTITNIFSIQEWVIDEDNKVDESDLNQIDVNKTLLGEDFVLDNDGEIDEDSFILNGADSLADIEADDIVYVYTNSNNKITKVEVGTETVTGVVSKIEKDSGAPVKYTIDGTVYDIVDTTILFNDAIDANIQAGNEITIALDYAGKVYASEVTAASAGNFAVVVATSGTPSNSAVASPAKIQLLTADGTIVYNVGSKYYDNATAVTPTSTTWSAITPGKIVKFAVNDSALVTKLVVTDDLGTDMDTIAEANKYTFKPLTASTDTVITPAGYVDGKAIADNAAIYAAPTDGLIPPNFVYSDADKLAVVSKADVLDTTAGRIEIVIDENTNKVVALIISDGSTSDLQYGIATSTYDIANSEIGVDFYLGTELIKDAVVDGPTPATVKDTAITKNLYVIKKTATGKYTFSSPNVATESNDVINIVNPLANGVSIKNGNITHGGATYALSGDLVVYVYDVSDDAYSIGSRSDLISTDTTEITVYQNMDSKSANYKLVDFAIAERP